MHRWFRSLVPRTDILYSVRLQKMPNHLKKRIFFLKYHRNVLRKYYGNFVRGFTCIQENKGLDAYKENPFSMEGRRAEILLRAAMAPATIDVVIFFLYISLILQTNWKACSGKAQLLCWVNIRVRLYCVPIELRTCMSKQSTLAFFRPLFASGL